MRSLSSASVARRLMINPIALPTINMPLANSPQRIFRSSIKDCSMSAMVWRGEKEACRVLSGTAGSGSSWSSGWIFPTGRPSSTISA